MFFINFLVINYNLVVSIEKAILLLLVKDSLCKGQENWSA